jgi:hypothetical protein
MKMAWILVIAVSLSMTGCGERKPNIAGCHWVLHNFGDIGTLYDSEGHELVDVVVGLDGEPSQACIFHWVSDVGPTPPCTNWETGQQAYDWVGREFEEHGKD